MKTFEQLFDEAAETELEAAERAYREARINVEYLSVNGDDEQFNNAWALAEATRNNLNWLRSVRK